MLINQLTFSQFNQENPCLGCPAPCCRMQLIPYRVPQTFMDMDHVRYMLLFPNTEMVVTLAGDWFVLKWEQCREFEAGTCTCKIHESVTQPRICFAYNAYNCWYKRNFVTEEPAELYRLNLARFDAWVGQILFDETGKIVSAPCFEDSSEFMKQIAIEPTFQKSAGLIKVEEVHLALDEMVAVR